jgi:hypothetical protein
MTPHAPPVDTSSDRIRLPFNFDVEKMTKEILALDLNTFIYYNVISLRSPAHLVDTSLPLPPPSGNYADGSWTDWLDTPQLDACPYIKTIVDVFREHTDVTLVRALRLEAGNVVKEHCDPTLGLQIEESVIRLTIPILSDETDEFYLNGELVPMKPGECWYMRLTDPHKVVNSGTTDRINITIDMIPNEWVKSLILENDEK